MIYMVVRHCCTSGNCDTCSFEEGHKFGNCVDVVQFLTRSKEKATEVANNWRAYGASVVRASRANIDNLHKRSRLWVFEQLHAKKGKFIHPH